MKLINFFKSVVQEMKEVTWPNAAQTRRDTSTVVGTSIIMAAFLGFFDWLFQWLISFMA